MAMSMDAVLRVKAAVTGDGAIAKMASGLGGLASQAGKAQKGLKSLAGAGGGLGQGLGALVPALSISGLGAMAMNSVKASAALYDLSVKTGVSVENLAKYRKAAGQTGTSIDSVGGGLLKLTKVMAMAAAAKGLSVPGAKAATDEMEELGLSGKGASQVFLDLGIRLTDANGKLRNAGDVFNELGGKIQAMPDGSEKVALLGKVIKGVGPEFLQMFNKFGDFSKVTTKVTTEQAKAAKDYENKLKQTSAAIGAVGANLGVSLLPALKTFANELAWLTKKFTSLPEPIQKLAGTMTLIGLGVTALAPAFTALGALLAPLFGLFIKLATHVKSLGGIISVIKLVGTGLAGLATWPVLIVAGIVAAVALIFMFRKQIGDFFNWLGGGFVSAMKALGEILYTVFVLPLVKLWDLVKEPVTSFFTWLGEQFPALWGKIVELAHTLFVEPFVKLWGLIKEPVTDYFTWLGETYAKLWDGLGKLGYTLFIEPFIKMWGMLQAPIVSIFNSITNTVKAALNNIISFFGNIVQGIINVANKAIAGFNRVSPVDIRLIDNVQIPRFAQGGFVTGPTLAMIGDNRSGREYAVPEEKATAFANNILAGRRGAAAIPSSGGMGSSGSGGGGPLTITVNLTTGPVMEQGGQRYVTIEDAERIARATAAQAVGQLRTPGGRRAAGIR